ncbi:MAG: NUDIX hydrolase [Bacteroidota bacterium]
MKNPWTKLSSEVIYDNPWIKLTEFQVLSPGGVPGIYGTAHFKNLAVGVVPLEGDMVWMVGQYRFPLDEYSWEIVEGGCPQGESPLETAKREMLEETGLRAEKYEKLLEMHLSNSVSDEWAIIYLATGLTEGEAEPEHSEDLQVKKMKFDDLFAAVEAGEIKDSMTVAAVYKMRILQLEGKLF